MNIIDKARVESAVQRFDFWMDLKGVPGKRRRDLRRELRANLYEAVAAKGAAAALDGLGQARAMAEEAAETFTDRRQPAWNSGFGLVAVWVSICLVVAALSALAFLDGVEAAGPHGQRIEGSLTAVPTSTMSAAFDAGGRMWQVHLEFSPWPVTIVAVVLFLLGARIWRVLTPSADRSGRAHPRVDDRAA